MKIQRRTTFKTSEWSGGTTTELFIYPKDGDYAQRNFIFRLSSATVDLEKSVFSDLSGFKRFIAPLEGTLNISHDEKNFKALALNELYTFDGGLPTISTGKCRDFNVMIKEGYNGSAENITVSPNQPHNITCNQNEILWIFSYNNTGEILLSHHDKTSQPFELEPLSLFICNTEAEQQFPNKITISVTKTMNLFYGKIVI